MNDATEPRWSRYYETPDALQMRVDDYFVMCDKKNTRPTYCGLALFLGFSSSTTLMQYRAYSIDYDEVVMTARLRIEEAYEDNLLDKPAGSSFALRCSGWQDKQHHVHEGVESFAAALGELVREVDREKHGKTEQE